MKLIKSKKFWIIGGAIVLFVVISLTVVAFFVSKPNYADEAAKPIERSLAGQGAQNATILSVDELFRQNGAIQICSTGNPEPGGLTLSSTHVVYQISKNKADTAALIKKVAAESGYGTLSYVTNGSADFYEGSNPATTIGFIVYGDRIFTDSCDPSPSSDPNQTAFMLSIMPTK